MISKEEVYKYLSEGLLSEKFFNFKEDDDTPESDNTQNVQDTDNTQDQKGTSNTERPDLSWHFVRDKMILYNGSADKPTEQYGIFADVIRYYQFKKEDNNNNNNNNNKKQDKVNKDFKTKVKNFATAATLGGITAVAADTASKAINSTADKNKKDKNGNEDKWKEFAQADFSNISAFQKHAQDHHVPSSLIDNFITSYNQLKTQSSQPKNNSQK